MITPTSDSISNVVKETGVTLVDFYADWCGPCQTLLPILLELEQQFIGVSFVKVNVDEWPGIAAEFEISSIPLLIVFKNGKEFRQIRGLVPKKEIIQVLEDSLPD